LTNVAKPMNICHVCSSVNQQTYVTGFIRRLTEEHTWITNELIFFVIVVNEVSRKKTRMFKTMNLCTLLISFSSFYTCIWGEWAQW
jgi:hypothetical protein